MFEDEGGVHPSGRHSPVLASRLNAGATRKARRLSNYGRSLEGRHPLVKDTTSCMTW